MLRDALMEVAGSDGAVTDDADDFDDEDSEEEYDEEE
jgi:hypothetical protein